MVAIMAPNFLFMNLAGEARSPLVPVGVLVGEVTGGCFVLLLYRTKQQ
jgi:hypothetical protein